MRVVRSRRQEMLRNFLEKCNGEVGASERVIRGGSSGAKGEEKDVKSTKVSPERMREAEKAAGLDGYKRYAKQAEDADRTADAQTLNGHAEPDAPDDGAKAKDGAAKESSAAPLAAATASGAAVAGVGAAAVSQSHSGNKHNGMPELTREVSAMSTVSINGEVFATPCAEIADDEFGSKAAGETAAVGAAAGVAGAAGVAAATSKGEEDKDVASPSTPTRPRSPVVAEKEEKVAAPAASSDETPKKSAVAFPDADTPRSSTTSAPTGVLATNGHDTHKPHGAKEGFQDFVKGGSHFFKQLKSNVAGVGHHSHGHRKSTSRSRTHSGASATTSESGPAAGSKRNSLALEKEKSAASAPAAGGLKPTSTSASVTTVSGEPVKTAEAIASEPNAEAPPDRASTLPTAETSSTQRGNGMVQTATKGAAAALSMGAAAATAAAATLASASEKLTSGSQQKQANAAEQAQEKAASPAAEPQSAPMAAEDSHDTINAEKQNGTTAAAAAAAAPVPAAAESKSQPSSSSSPKKAKGDSKSVKVLYFAGARTALGKSEEEVELPSRPFALSKLGALLVERHRAHDVLGDFEKVVKMSKWSVDEEMAEGDEAEGKMLQGGEEVAIIPPVSGG